MHVRRMREETMEDLIEGREPDRPNRIDPLARG
jgi:hypothetical protein